MLGPFKKFTFFWPDPLSSNPRRWRGERLQHHGDVVCHGVCAFCVVSDSWLVSRTCRTYILEVLQSGPPRLAPYPGVQSEYCQCLKRLPAMASLAIVFCFSPAGNLIVALSIDSLRICPINKHIYYLTTMLIEAIHQKRTYVLKQVILHLHYVRSSFTLVY